MKERDELKRKQRTLQGEVILLTNNIAKEEELPFHIWQEEVDREGESPDLIVSVLKGSRWKDCCFIELENPKKSPYDPSFVKVAHKKADKHGVKYFATWTVNELVLWRTFKEDTLLMERDQIFFDRHDVGLRVLTYDAALQKTKALNDFLRKFLKRLYDVYQNVEEIKRPRLDEVFIRFLNSVINSLSMITVEQIGRILHEDPKFRRKFSAWRRREQIRGPNANVLGAERAAKQFAYMLVNKIFFYNMLRSQGHDLPLIPVHENLSGEDAQGALRSTFKDVVNKIDYGPIFLADFVDDIPIPDEAVPLLGMFISELEKHDFSEVDYEIMGNIYQGVIPKEERHVMGQYFTKSDVVDLIVGFCVKDPNAIVLDPACGAGTFLVRSYSRIKYFDRVRPHDKILMHLAGVDISKFPCHVATINLVSKDLSPGENYPRILRRDFFKTVPGKGYKTTVSTVVEKLHHITLRGPARYRLEVVESPRHIQLEKSDAVVTNPPYTRQEEMEKQAFPKGYREKLRKLIEKEWNLPVGKRSSIYSHFFFHCGEFLKEGGKLGTITSNSWLDVDYGKYLQEFLLRNFKIVAVIESKLERWFEDADINTAITILERCGDEEQRNENLVKFVQLKKPLKELIPTTGEEWGRWGAVDEFVNHIEATNDFVEDDRIRVFTKKQGELWNEGFLDGKYRGGKWGKYLRAPEIFFKILEKKKDLFVPLKEVAEVRFGIKTGANEFFYLTEEQIGDWGIEKEFWMHRENGRWVPNYVIKSPRECKSVIVKPEDLKYRVLMIHKDKKDLEGTNVLKYIGRGEERGFHKRPTCASRPRWYELSPIEGDLLCMMSLNDRYIFWVNENTSFDARLYGISLKNKQVEPKILGGIITSSFTPIIIELWGRLNLGQGALDVKVYEYEEMPTIDPSKLPETQIKRLTTIFDSLAKRKMGSVFEEIGAERLGEVSLAKVKPDRRELDRIVMGEILGLTEEEQLEVYRAVVDLVRSRIERARSVKRGL